jgi:hypothetical protein
MTLTPYRRYFELGTEVLAFFKSNEVILATDAECV